MDIIDAHHHIWRIGENGHEWPTPEQGRLYRTVTTAEFETLARGVGVTGSVLVQSQPSDEDTDFLTDLGLRCFFVKAIVGWVDLKSAGAVARIEALSARPKLRGLRPMLQSLADDWLDDPALAPAIEAMISRGLRFDALILEHQLAALIRFCDRYPELKVVVDHAAKPSIGGDYPGQWHEDMAAIARLPNVYCKLSGLLTEAPPGSGEDALHPYVSRILTEFGPLRTLWGSDWPVLEMATPYSRWLELARSMVPEPDWPDVFSRTACRFYGLDQTGADTFETPQPGIVKAPLHA
jgi:L-fuconolactonase